MSSFSPASRDAPLFDRLQAFPFFSRLSPDGQQQMLAAVSAGRFPVGATLLTQGGDCQSLLLIERGGIRVYKLASTGREITLYQVGPGESCVLGVSCIINQQNYPALACTISRMDALVVPATLFRNLYESESAVRSFVMQLYSLRIANLMLLVEEVAFAKMDKRLAAFLIDHAVSGPAMRRPVCLSHEEIAAHLGTAREVVSRLLQQFSEQGLISSGRKRIEIEDLERMKKLTAEQ